MNSPISQMDDLRLIALPSAVNCAELFAKFTMFEWSLRPLTEEASRVAGALTSAAVANSDHRAPGFIVVRLQLRGDWLLVEVEDGEFTTPALPPVLTNRQAAVRRKTGRGNVLWCQVPLPPGLTASSVPLPRRERRKSPAAERLGDEPDDVDPQFMQRVLHGLNRSRHAQPE